MVALLLSVAAPGALPGVTELETAPEAISDARLAALLDRRIASADVVAIGETVHGSSGFLRIQTRLIRYLVEKHGHRLILWENPTSRSLELARWVAACTSAVTPAPIDVLYMPTPSDLPLWEWVCAFNRQHRADPIVFRGIDVWDRPWEHYAAIRLGSRAGIDVALLKDIETFCPASRATSWPAVNLALAQAQDAGRCSGLLTTVLDSARRAAIDRRRRGADGADAAFELALSASTLRGWLDFHYNASDDVVSWNARDLAQATNALLLMEKHRAPRAIVSAHSSHVSHNRSPADWWGFGDIRSGMHFLARLSGKHVFNIALTAYEASGTQGHWSLPAARNSLDRKLHDAGHTFAFFPADAAFLSEYPKWWIQNQNYPGRYESGVELVVPDHFDAVFFFDRSHLDRALPSRPMWEP